VQFLVKDTIEIGGIKYDVYSLNTIVVGSGAAGLNAADSLYTLGQKDIALLTEGLYMGTSRNTGSDKQTYYKITLAGDSPDSVVDMAKTLFEGGSMHGDIALIEAALSARSFFKLVNIGVPFPHNRYGEYVGYKTDHDPRQRATSAGPLTSRYMTERLLEQVISKSINIFDGYLAIGILTQKTEDGGKKAVGLVALDTRNTCSENYGITLFNCTNIIYATGGPAGMYQRSVYPPSQTGGTGIALEAGARGVNLTESQFGIASIKFRWNLSGSYQQVIPRYVSTDKNGGDEREFLEDYFDNVSYMLNAIFLKGYQWPFDARKVNGSSLIDILVYNETQTKGRRVFLDFTRNPGKAGKDGCFDFSLLGREAYEYLKNSGCLFGRPIDRLMKMNAPAVELYKNNGIDLSKEYLEIDVCAQHCNGGLLGNIWWESNLKHFFPVGEVNGTFGVYRPGGSALNSTQTGSLRAAQYICHKYTENPPVSSRFADENLTQIQKYIGLVKKFTGRIDEILEDDTGGVSNVYEIRESIQRRMTKYGAMFRSLADVEKAYNEAVEQLETLPEETRISSLCELPDAFRNRDLLITQAAFLFAFKEYIRAGGISRGSYLICDPKGILPAKGLPENLKYISGEDRLRDKVCEVLACFENCVNFRAAWENVRPIPEEDNWFENVWNSFMNNDIIK